MNIGTRRHERGAPEVERIQRRVSLQEELDLTLLPFDGVLFAEGKVTLCIVYSNNAQLRLLSGL